MKIHTKLPFWVTALSTITAVNENFVPCKISIERNVTCIISADNHRKMQTVN